MIKLLLKFEELDKRDRILINVVIIVIITSLDYLISSLSFSIFYLIPIVLIAWTSGKNLGFIFAIIGTILWAAADVAGENFFFHFRILIWNSLLRLGFFLIAIFLLTAIRIQVELREDLIHYIMHDLRIPMLNILASLSILKEEANYKKDSDQKKLIELSINSGEKMIHYISSLIDIDRLDSKMMPKKISEIDTAEVVDEVIKQLKTFILEKRIEIKKIIKVQKINTDEYLLLRILTNLLSNAIKVSPADSEIAIKILSFGETGVEFHVIDQGTGINEEMKDFVFKKYSQAELLNKKRIDGSGLGLTFCKKAIEALGGSIRIENNLNHGVDIIFTLLLI